MSTPAIEAAPFSEPKNQKRIEANRANAQLSTGPTSETGKAKSSLNAVKTGLTRPEPSCFPPTRPPSTNCLSKSIALAAFLYASALLAQTPATITTPSRTIF